MSNDVDNTEPQGEVEETTAPQGVDDQQVQDEKPQGTDWQAEARKWESRAKKDAKALDELKQQVQTLVSPEQVASKEQQLAEATAAAEQARHEALRLRVALDEGLPPALAARLHGDSEEALREDAAVLKQMVKAPAGQDAKKGQAAAPPIAKPSATELLRTIVKG